MSSNMLQQVAELCVKCYLLDIVAAELSSILFSASWKLQGSPANTPHFQHDKNFQGFALLQGVSTASIASCSHVEMPVIEQ